MRKYLFLLGSIFSLLLVTKAPALAGPGNINGPVNITVDSKTYGTFYSTNEYYKVLQNYTQTVGPSITAPTNSPNNLYGIAEAFSFFSQPWWTGGIDPTGAKAQAAAIQWYNTSGFPINQGVQLPNGSHTPYFAYSTGDTSDLVRYAYAYFDGGSGQVVSSIAQSDILNDNFSYALAGPLSQ